MSERDSSLVRADAWAGIVFLILGAVIAFESWRMPRLEERLIDPFTEPGIVPGLLGGALALLGAILMLRAAREGGFAGPPITAEWLGRASTKRMLLSFVLCIFFALVMVGRIPFTPASFLFLSTFMLVFGLRPNEPGAVRRGVLLIVVSAVAAGCIHYLFQELFLVRLP